MRYLILLTALLFSGCSSLLDTSFYDSNESLLAVEVRYAVENLNCKRTTDKVRYAAVKLRLYSESKGSKDVYSLVEKLEKTAEGITMNMSPTVCNIKKKILAKQSKDIAYAIMRRY